MRNFSLDNAVTRCHLGPDCRSHSLLTVGTSHNTRVTSWRPELLRFPADNAGPGVQEGDTAALTSELRGPESERRGLWPPRARHTTPRVLAVRRSRDLCARPAGLRAPRKRARPPRACCPTHPLPEARRSGGRRRQAPRPSSVRAATRSRKCPAPRSGAAALGAREVRGRSGLGGVARAGRGEKRGADSHALTPRFPNRAGCGARLVGAPDPKSRKLYSSAFGLIVKSRFPDENVFPDVFGLFVLLFG